MPRQSKKRGFSPLSDEYFKRVNETIKKQLELQNRVLKKIRKDMKF